MNDPVDRAAEAHDKLRAEIERREALIAEQPTRQLDGDTVWTRDESPIIVDQNVYIAPGSTLTIEPGVVVAFNQANMNIDGKMFAVGTPRERILLTSIEDPELITPGKAPNISSLHWPGIWIRSEGSVKLSYADFRYAGWDRFGLNEFTSAITADTDGRFEMDHSTIRYSLGNGLLSGINSNPEAMTVSRSIISDNAGRGISIYESYVEVRDGTLITNNGGDGIYKLAIPSSGRQTVVMNSDIVGNGGAGISLNYYPVPAKQESYGHGNNIYKNSANAQIACVWPPNNHLQNSAPFDWSDNYFGAPLIETKCPWSGAPAYSNHTHLSYKPHLSWCEKPPEGPISYQIFERRPEPECPEDVAYCAVDQVNAAPAATTPFDNNTPTFGVDQTHL